MDKVPLYKIDARSAESGLERIIHIDSKPIRVRLHFTVNGTDQIFACAVKTDGKLLQDVYGGGGAVDGFSWETGGDKAIADLVTQLRSSGIPQELLNSGLAENQNPMMKVSNL